jgi:hypothetical protein
MKGAQRVGIITRNLESGRPKNDEKGQHGNQPLAECTFYDFQGRFYHLWAATHLMAAVPPQKVQQIKVPDCGHLDFAPCQPNLQNLVRSIVLSIHSADTPTHL